MIQSVPKRLFRKLITKYFIPNAQVCYSQYGEDLIIGSLFYSLGIHKPTYLDIGANEAKYISNTFYFYEQGGKGVCVEPNPYLYKKLKKIRSRDVIINAGVGTDSKAEADFFLFPNYANGLSTFSKKEAMHWEEVGMPGLGKIKIDKIIKIPLITIDTIFETYFKTAPDLLSIDVEGLDYDILASLDLIKYRPKIICTETLFYDNNQKGYKIPEIEKLLLSKGYILYADTRVNSIFCLKELIH